MLQYLAFLLVGAAVSALITKCVRDVANRRGMVFAAQSERHIHPKPMPRLGGVAIFASFSIVLAVYLLIAHFQLVRGPLSHDLVNALPGGALLFAAGLLDDCRGMGARTKLLVQAAGGAWLYAAGIRFGVHTGSSPGVNWGAGLVETVLCVVLLCNAINLIDGLDGLAAGISLFSMVPIFAVAVISGRTGITTATAILAGSIIGFLFFNFNPATIFLGDSGSLFLGFALSFLLLEESKNQSMVDSVVMPLAALALPLTDTAVSALRRFLGGRSIFRGDGEHIHHKLLEKGWTQRQAVSTLYGCEAGCALLSLLLLHPSDLMAIPVAGIVFAGMFQGVKKLGYHEFRELRRLWRIAVHQRRNLARNIATRKAAASLRRMHTPETIGAIVQECLQHQFEGFEIVLDEGYAICGTSGEIRHLRRRWSCVAVEKARLVMELNTPSLGTVGHFSVIGSMRQDPWPDLGLITGDLRAGLEQALENYLLGPREAAAKQSEGETRRYPSLPGGRLEAG